MSNTDPIIEPDTAGITAADRDQLAAIITAVNSLDLATMEDGSEALDEWVHDYLGWADWDPIIDPATNLVTGIAAASLWIAAAKWFFRPTPASVLVYAETAALLIAMAVTR